MTLPDSGAQIINFIEPHVTATEETSVILNGLGAIDFAAVRLRRKGALGVTFHPSLRTLTRPGARLSCQQPA
jgi:hypothetical protein